MLFTRFTISIAVVVVLLVGLLAPSGCKRSGGSGSSSITNFWKKYDTPPGADPSVPDTLGGKGFENVAASMGYVTYDIKPEEEQYFGAKEAKKGGEIVFGEMTFPTTFRPEGQHSSLAVNTDIKGYVYETLLTSHPITREYIPILASHWKISPDKKTFTFRINPEARWSDGKPVVASDVVATWNLMVDEGLLEPAANLVYSKFEKPVAKSKYIVEVTAKTVNFRNLLYFGAGMPIYPAHEIGNLTGKEFLEKYNFNMPAGSGPYVINEKDIKHGQGWTLTRRDDWWAKETTWGKNVANFDFVKYIVVKENPRLLYEKFKSGEIDLFLFTMTTTEWWVNDTDYQSIKNGMVRRFRFYTNGPMGTSGIAYNMRKPPFDDIRVRRAFNMLYPRETVVEKLLYNEYEVYDTDYPNTPFASVDNPKTPYDPAGAQKLLAEAGYTSRNAQGILVKNGRPFVLEMAMTKNNERWLTLYQEELKKAGIDLKLKFMDWNALIKNIDERNFNIFAYGYSGMVTPNPETSLKSELADKNNNTNIFGFKNARVDELLPVYDSTFEVSKQIQIIREIDRIVAENCIKSWWWNPKGIRLAVWDKFGMPEYGLSRYTQLSFVFSSAGLTWWYDADKAKAVAEAKKSQKDLGGNKGIQEFRYWREFKENN